MKWSALTLLAMLAALPLGAASLAEEAKAAWQTRGKPGQTEQAIRLWRQAAEKEPSVAEHRINLAKALGRAVRHAKTSKEKRKWAEEARRTAEAAVKLAPTNGAAYAIQGEALGQWANARKSVRSLGAVKKAVASLNKAIELNPKDAYAHMLLTEFYRQAPSVLSIGDKQKALHHARLAVEHGPAYAINHLVLAKTLLDLGQKEEATRELHLIEGLSPPPDAIPETQADQATAHFLLESLGIKDSHSNSCGESNAACTEAP